MKQKPFLNLGCGKMHMPAPKPGHYGLIPDGLCDYALWLNVDASDGVGADEVVNIFEYPFRWDDNSFDGALLAHIAEHIPHGSGGVADGGDGFFRFFSELHRVLTPSACVHVLSPYAMSYGALIDPTHTRYLMPETFSYLVPDPDAPFQKGYGGVWNMVTKLYNVTPYGHSLQHDPGLFDHAMAHNWNVCHEFYVKLEVVK